MPVEKKATTTPKQEPSPVLKKPLTMLEGEIPQQEKAGFLQLPVPEAQFAGFIRSLLGIPQSTSRNFYGPFELTRNDIKNINALIAQRISQQNHGSLIQFNARVVYNDDSSIDLGDFEQFITYQETRDVASTALHLMWEYVIKFADKETPEIQRILISFICGRSTIADETTEFDALPEDDSIFSYLLPFDRYAVSRRLKGSINLRIECTARTWGADIDALLSPQLTSLQVRLNKNQEFIAKHSKLFAVAATLIPGCLLSMCLSIYQTHLNKETIAEFIKSSATSSGQSNTYQHISKKIDVLAEHLINGSWNGSTVLTVFSILAGALLCLLIGGWIDRRAVASRDSFILLTGNSERQREMHLTKLNRSKTQFIVSIFVGIAVNLVSAIIFARYTGK